MFPTSGRQQYAVTKKGCREDVAALWGSSFSNLFSTFALFKELVHCLLCSGVREGEVSERGGKKKKEKEKSERVCEGSTSEKQKEKEEVMREKR